MRLVDKHFPCHYKYFKLFNRNSIKSNCSCMSSMNNVIQKHNSKIMKDPASSTIKNEKSIVKKQSVLWMVSVFLSALFTKHLLIQLIVNIAMLLVKILSRNVSITMFFRNKSRKKNTELSKYA